MMSLKQYILYFMSPKSRTDMKVDSTMIFRLEGDRPPLILNFCVNC